MTSTNDNENYTYGIEKFEGTFDKEELGVTIVPNRTINEIRNPEALGVYVYLLARPKGWKLNTKQLSDHFQCGKDKMLRILNWLLNETFITCTMVRNQGRYTKPHYRVLLSRLNSRSILVDPVDEIPETQAQPDFSPEPENPSTVNPDAENTDAYKTKSIENKEYNKKPYVDSAKSTEVPEDYSADDHFMKFYEIYPNKQKPRVAHVAFYKAARRARMDVEAFSQMVYEDILVRLKNNWAGRPKNKYPFPQKYLNDAEWQGEINTPDVKEVKANGHTNGASDPTSYW